MDYYLEDNNFIFYQPLFRNCTVNFEQQMIYSPSQMRFYHFYMPPSYLENTVFNCVPDGCVDMLFIYNDNDYMVEFVGSTVSRKILKSYPGYSYFGLRLKPGMFVALDDVSLAEVTNSEILYSSRDLDVADFIEQLQVLVTLQDKIDLFLKEFSVSLTAAFITDPVRNILCKINDTKGNISVADLARDQCYSERQISRLMESQINIGPKMLCRIVRFQNALDCMINRPDRETLDYIAGLNYSDQSHFNREFKEFTGLTPQQFVKNFKNETARP
ncbi:MAG: AraC family transcriptional regulator, partial [Clostridiales Family XIII bacterium]|nr:AraC family transcriptional regulator [Clostridiales Family XIII bacterium]